MAVAEENWCIDYTIYPPADADLTRAINYRAMAYRESNTDLMRTAYPTVTKQNESCAKLGYTTPLDSKVKDFKQEKQANGTWGYTFTAEGTLLEGKGAVVENSFWAKATPAKMVMLI